MNIAKNAKQLLVNAENANYGIYFCSECNQLVYLRKPSQQIPHFYHFRFNPSCSYCIKSGEDQWNNGINESFQAIETLKKNSTLENWFSAIDCLIRNNHLFLLAGLEWAINPVSLYINNHIETITRENLYKLVLVFINNQSVRSTIVLFNTLSIPKLTKSDQVSIISTYVKYCSHISDEVVNHLLDNDCHIEIIFKVFPYLSSGKQIEIGKIKKYQIIPYVYSLIDPNITYQDCLISFKILTTQDKKHFLKDEWILLLKLLRESILETNDIVRIKLIDHIDKEMIKTKYIIED